MDPRMSSPAHRRRMGYPSHPVATAEHVETPQEEPTMPERPQSQPQEYMVPPGRGDAGTTPYMGDVVNMVRQSVMNQRPENQGQAVQKGHSKTPVDPSAGTAGARTYAGQTQQERLGARLQVDKNTHAVYQPEHPSLQSKGRIIQPSGGVHGPFQDAPYIGYYG